MEIDEPRPQFPFRMYNAGQMAMYYEVNKKTFLKMIKPFQEKIGERIGHFYSIRQVKIIVWHLGAPQDYADLKEEPK